jgi:hypothetical protein
MELTAAEANARLDAMGKEAERLRGVIHGYESGRLMRALVRFNELRRRLRFG